MNFYRAVQSREPTAIAQAVAISFMGVRSGSWSKQRWSEMGTFFARIGYKTTEQWKEEIVIFDPGKDSGQSVADGPVEAVFPDGASADSSRDRIPRTVFADWLPAAEESLVRAQIVNRVWAWLLGRGIINEPDDIRPDNPPSNPELLAYLEKVFVTAHYDPKHLFGSF